MRLMQEYKRCNSAAFITLTYHPKYVPDEGVSKRHFQLFMKRLRKKSGKKLRYYAVGEYGTKTNRPHYHAIIFNYEGKEKFLQSIWCHPKTKEPLGIVHIGKVTEASVKYTTKYIIQRVAHTSKLAKPFALMSRSYALGGHYLSDEMVKWHRENNANYTLMYGQKGRLPRFFKQKIWPKEHERKRISDESAFQARKVHRKNLQLFYKKYGNDARDKMTEMRSAVVSRIKEKVAFTQTL